MIRVLVADGHPDRRERLRHPLAQDPDIEIVGLARDGQEAVLLAHQRRADVAVLAADLSAGDGFETAERLAAARSLGVQTILLSPEDSPDTLRRAMRAGAHEHLTYARALSDLPAAVRAVYQEGQRRRSADFAAAADPRQAARVFAVSGAKGGIGKTTLSVNLAVALARETGAPTALLDLYTQFGDVTMLLNLTPRRTLGDLTALAPSQIDAALLEDCLEGHTAGLHVLAGPPEPLALDALSVPTLEHVIGLLKSRFRYIVLDVPPVLHPTTLYALSHATRTVLVANLFDITTLHDSRRLLHTLEGKYVAADRVALVLNRVSPRNRIAQADIEETLGRAVTAQIPNDGRLVPASVNLGVPFVQSHPGSPVAQAVRGLACALAELEVPRPEKRRRLLPLRRTGPVEIGGTP